MEFLLDFFDYGLTAVLVGGVSYFVYKNYLSKSSSNSSQQDEWDSFLARERQKNQDKEQAMNEAPTTKRDSNNYTFKVIFATQSGTAEGFANDLAQDSSGFGFNIDVVDIEEYSVDDLHDEDFVLFLVATYGEGEPTDNAKPFYEELKKGQLDFANLQYAIYGLGNKQYQYFNEMAKQFHSILENAGSKPLMDVAMGDDDEDIDEHFSNWKDQFWAVISQELLGRPVQQQAKKAYEPGLAIEWINPETLKKFHRDKLKRKFHSVFPKEQTVLAEITDNYEARVTDTDGSTRNIEINIEDCDIRYKTADNCGILCRNDYYQAGSLCTRLNVKADATCALSTKRSKTKLPCSKYITPMIAFLWYFDINAAPKSKLMRICAQYAEDKNEKQMLLDMAETSLKDSPECWTTLRLLNAFPSVKIPFEVLIEILPKLQYRLYTIASSSVYQPNSISVCAKLETDIRSDNTQFRGVCSNYIATMKPQDKVQIVIKKSHFKLPRKKETPVIMVGPGTGLAPFRAFIQEKQSLLEHGETFGHWRLYYGCRRRDVDYIYKDELENAYQDGVLDELYCAFSREQEQKIYVQDLIREHGEEIHLLLKKRCVIYVCGASGMGKAVREAFIHILMNHGRRRKLEEAKSELDLMLKTNRYIQELWG